LLCGDVGCAKGVWTGGCRGVLALRGLRGCVVWECRVEATAGWGRWEVGGKHVELLLSRRGGFDFLLILYMTSITVRRIQEL